MENTRRDFIKTSVLAAGALTFGLPGTSHAATNYPYLLPALPFAYDALEPHIDALTMQIHHDRHHQTYIDKLNAALDKFPEQQKKSLEDLFANISALPNELRTPIRNHGGGHWNHTYFWQMLSPEKSEPSTALTEGIKTTFGNMDEMKVAMNKAGAGLFGSGWVWLIQTESKELKIVTTANQNNPLMGDSADRGTPLIGFDVWEHAYYLKYQNKRADYLGALWNVLNWKFISERFV